MRIISILSLILLAGSLGFCVDHTDREVIELWPGKVPGKVIDMKEKTLPSRPDGVIRLTNVSKPTITLYKAKPADKPLASVVICPGGGYNILAWNKEGTDVARWLNSVGVTAVVLRYRVPKNRLGALQDVQRAVRMVRHNASKWNVDPDRVGVLGFSAGGHLTASISTSYMKDHYAAVDQADKLSSRPDFSVLVYPAYLLTDNYRLPEDIKVTKDTPPAFLVHAQNDKSHIKSSLCYYLALFENKVPAEMHLYPTGGHGFGLGRQEFEISNWPSVCADWMRSLDKKVANRLD